VVDAAGNIFQLGLNARENVRNLLRKVLVGAMTI